MGVFDIQGRDCVFQLKIGDDYFTVVCAKSFTFNPVTDMKETTTVGSGFWKEFRPRKLSYTITFNGMFQVASLVTQEKIKTMFDYQIGFLPLNYRLLYTDASSNVMIVDGTVYVTSTLLDASPVNLVNGTVELQGTGPIQVLDELPTPINIHIVSTGDPLIGAFVQFKLINTDGEIIFDSGQLPGASGGNLSHPVDVTGQVAAGSYYFFWQTTADSVSNVFTLDAPPTKSTNFSDGTQNENSFGVQIYDFTSNRTVTFALGTATPPPTCVPAFIPAGVVLPDGQVGNSYAYLFQLGGSAPFVANNIVKPSWMTIFLGELIAGGPIYAQITGTPDIAGTGIVVSFDIDNGCGHAEFSDTIDIAAAPASNPIINYDFDQNDPTGLMRIYVNAVLVYDLSSNASGTFYANPGDVIEVQVLGHFADTTKTLLVENTTDTITLYSDSDIVTQTFSFAAAANKAYLLAGIVDPV